MRRRFNRTYCCFCLFHVQVNLRCTIYLCATECIHLRWCTLMEICSWGSSIYTKYYVIYHEIKFLCVFILLNNHKHNNSKKQKNISGRSPKPVIVGATRHSIIYIYIYICTGIYIYIYIERERETYEYIQTGIEYIYM